MTALEELQAAGADLALVLKRLRRSALELPDGGDEVAAMWSRVRQLGAEAFEVHARAALSQNPLDAVAAVVSVETDAAGDASEEDSTAVQPQPAAVEHDLDGSLTFDPINEFLEVSPVQEPLRKSPRSLPQSLPPLDELPESQPEEEPEDEEPFEQINPVQEKSRYDEAGLPLADEVFAETFDYLGMDGAARALLSDSVTKKKGVK